jgi:hypothetical protein
MAERYTDSFFELHPRQKAALVNRYGQELVEKEFVNARNWLREMHTGGKPYTSFLRFFWNWCRREIEWQERKKNRSGSRQRERVSGGYLVRANSEEEALAIARGQR